MRQRSIPGSIGVVKTGLRSGLSRRGGGIVGIARRPRGAMVRLLRWRIACRIVGARVILLAPAGRLLPLALVTIAAVGIVLLAPLALATIPARGVAAGLLPLTVWVPIPAIIIPVLVPLAPVIVPAKAIAARLLPLALPIIYAVSPAVAMLPGLLLAIPAEVWPVLVPLALVAIPAVGVAAGLLPLLRLMIPAESITPGLLTLMVWAVPAEGIAPGLRLKITAGGRAAGLRMSKSLAI